MASLRQSQTLETTEDMFLADPETMATEEWFVAYAQTLDVRHLLSEWSYWVNRVAGYAVERGWIERIPPDEWEASIGWSARRLSLAEQEMTRRLPAPGGRSQPRHAAPTPGDSEV